MIEPVHYSQVSFSSLPVPCTMHVNFCRYFSSSNPFTQHPKCGQLYMPGHRQRCGIHKYPYGRWAQGRGGIRPMNNQSLSRRTVEAAYKCTPSGLDLEQWPVRDPGDFHPMDSATWESKDSKTGSRKILEVIPKSNSSFYHQLIRKSALRVALD